MPHRWGGISAESLDDKKELAKQQNWVRILEPHAWNSKCKDPGEEWTWLILQGVRVRTGSNLGHRLCIVPALPKDDLGPGVLRLHQGSRFLKAPSLSKSLWHIPIRTQILMDSCSPDKGHLGGKDHRVLGKEVPPLPSTVQEGALAVLLDN